jgi:hypothetical protein
VCLCASARKVFLRLYLSVVWVCVVVVSLGLGVWVSCVSLSLSPSPSLWHLSSLSYSVALPRELVCCSSTADLLDRQLQSPARVSVRCERLLIYKNVLLFLENTRVAEW